MNLFTRYRWCQKIRGIFFDWRILISGYILSFTIYLALVIIIFFLLLLNTPNAIEYLDAYSALVLLFFISSPLFLVYGCVQYHMSWLRGDLGYDEFRFADLSMKFVRFFTYVVCTINLCLAWKGEPFICNKDLMFVFSVGGFAVFQSSLQSAWLTTFRHRSNYAIAIANAILYLALLDTACNNDSLFFGWMNIGDHYRLWLGQNLQPFLAYASGGLLVTIVLTMLQDSFGNLLVTMTSHNPSNLSQQRRRNRRRLLTHWQYKQDGAASLHEDSSIRLLLIEAITVVIAFLWALWKSSLAARKHNLTEVVPIFSVYLIVLAALILVPAIMSLWSISDEKLIQSEYTFLTIQSVRLRLEDIRNSYPRWRDFCQVLVNLASNVSGLESEDEGFHKIHHNIFQLHKHIGSQDQCAQIKFITDILSTKGNTNAALLRESGHEDASIGDNEGKKPAKQEHLRQARDVQFATILTDLLNKFYGEGPNIPCTELNPLLLILMLDHIFFEGNNDRWAQRLSPQEMDAMDGIRMVRTDVLIRILQRESQPGCGVSWLGCTCTDKPKDCVNLGNNSSCTISSNYLENRMELMLQYPFMVIRSYCDRWSDERSIFFVDEILHYYRTIALAGISTRNKEQIKRVVYRTYRDLLEMNVDISILPYVTNLFDALMCSPSSDEHLKETIKTGKKLSLSFSFSLDEQFKHLERFNGAANIDPNGRARDALKDISCILFPFPKNSEQEEQP